MRLSGPVPSEGIPASRYGTGAASRKDWPCQAGHALGMPPCNDPRLAWRPEGPTGTWGRFQLSVARTGNCCRADGSAIAPAFAQKERSALASHVTADSASLGRREEHAMARSDKKP